MKVLIADDDPVYINLLQELLTKWQFQPVIARDGLAAWGELCTPGGPQLAIIDWLMPRMDGHQLTQQIRQTGWGQRVYIILITDGRQKDKIMQVLVSGADDYMIKPFEPVDLQVHLRTGLRVLSLQEKIEQLESQARLTEA